MEEEKSAPSLSVATLRSEFDKIKQSATQKALFRMEEDFSQIFNEAKKRLLKHIEEKVEETASAVILHMMAMSSLREDTARLRARIGQFGKTQQMREKCEVKLEEAYSKIADMISARSAQYAADKSEIEVLIAPDKIAELVASHVGMQLYVSQEYIIKKNAPMSLKESTQNKKVFSKLVQHLGKERKKAQKLFDDVPIGNKKLMKIILNKDNE